MPQDQDLVQLQCPKCGGYKVANMRTSACFFEIMHYFLIAMTFGIWLIVMFIWRKISGPGLVKDGDPLRCRMCGYTWHYRE